MTRDRRPLWLAPTTARPRLRSRRARAMLQAAGIPSRPCPADIDERAVEAPLGAERRGAGRRRRRAGRGQGRRGRAMRHPGRVVLGADQTLACDGERLHKPARHGRGAPRSCCRCRAGPISLHSGGRWCATATTSCWRHVETRRLTMRPLSDGHHRPLSARGRRKAPVQRRRLPDRRRRASSSSSASRATISPSSACRSCRCSPRCASRPRASLSADRMAAMTPRLRHRLSRRAIRARR